MSSSFRVIGVNLMVLIFLVASIRLLNRYDEFGYALITAMAIATQLLTNLLFAILHDNSDARLAHLLSIALLLLIGFGACVGGAAIRF
jgi:O-antigen/teichoic acid export membrane protein